MHVFMSCRTNVPFQMAAIVIFNLFCFLILTFQSQLVLTCFSLEAQSSPLLLLILVCRAQGMQSFENIRLIARVGSRYTPELFSQSFRGSKDFFAMFKSSSSAYLVQSHFWALIWQTGCFSARTAVSRDWACVKQSQPNVATKRCSSHWPEMWARLPSCQRHLGWYWVHAESSSRTLWELHQTVCAYRERRACQAASISA